jgi:hypothetical protein
VMDAPIEFEHALQPVFSDSGLCAHRDVVEKESPIARSLSAWCPARRRPLKPSRSSPSSSRSTISPDTPPPRACSAARKEAAARGTPPRDRRLGRSGSLPYRCRGLETQQGYKRHRDDSRQLLG